MHQVGNCLKRLAVVMAVLLFASVGAVAQDEVYIDHIDGLAYPGAIMAGQPITIYIRYRVETDTIFSAYTGHRLYSPDGAQWSIPSISASVPNLSDYWEAAQLFRIFSSDGISPDTLGFAAWTFGLGGLPIGYDSGLYQISFTVDEAQVGKTICLDSSWTEANVIWQWALKSGGYLVPLWKGPYCFEVVPCCWGPTGDVNLDGSVNIADMDRMVGYLFRGESLDCPARGNMDGMSSGSEVDVSDLTYFVAYIFLGGPALAPCQ